MTPPTEASVLLEAFAALFSIAAVAGMVAAVGRLVQLPWRRPRPVLSPERRRVREGVRGTGSSALTPSRSPIPGLGDVSAVRGEAAAVP